MSDAAMVAVVGLPAMVTLKSRFSSFHSRIMPRSKNFHCRSLSHSLIRLTGLPGSCPLAIAASSSVELGGDQVGAVNHRVTDRGVGVRLVRPEIADGTH